MRCLNCKKKTNFQTECKCLKKFCLNCLPYYAHECTYDYKTEKKTILVDNNPKIEAEKIIVI